MLPSRAPSAPLVSRLAHGQHADSVGGFALPEDHFARRVFLEAQKRRQTVDDAFRHAAQESLSRQSARKSGCAVLRCRLHLNFGMTLLILREAHD